MAEPTSSADKKKASQAYETVIKFVFLSDVACLLVLAYDCYREQLSFSELAKHETLLQQWFQMYPWLVFGVAFLISGWLSRKRCSDSRCQECGYDLTGNESGVCPECGTPASEPVAEESISSPDH